MILFSSTLVAEIFVIVKVKMRVDLSMVIISLASLLSFGMRAFLDGKMNYLTAYATLLIQATMYYFVFEMRRVRDKLSSESLVESLAKAKRTRALKWIVFGSFFTFCVAPLVAFFAIGKTEDPTMTGIIDGILLMISLVKFSISFFILFQFYHIFFYFVNLKRCILVSNSEDS